jgi:hypothetical protein
LFISKGAYQRKNVYPLVVIVGLMVGVLLRFRVQLFLPALPGFLAVIAYGWWRTRQGGYIVGGLAALAVSFFGYSEMLSPVYLSNTAKLVIGNNGLAFSPLQTWLNSWPLSSTINSWLSHTLNNEELYRWAWQIVSISMFALFNVVGLVLLAVTVIYLYRKAARREWGTYTFFTLWLVLASTLGAMLISIDYDAYSVGGQMLFHTSWFLFPFLGVAAWQVYELVRNRTSWGRPVWAALAAAVVIGAFVFQQVRPPSILEQMTREESSNTVLTGNEWLAISYIHDHTSPQAVILTNRQFGYLFAIFSGLAGRAAYNEYPANILRDTLQRLDSQGDRSKRISDIWGATTQDRLCEAVTSTNATHLVEYSKEPLKVHPPGCLREAWASPEQPEKVTIWEIVRR